MNTNGSAINKNKSNNLRKSLFFLLLILATTDFYSFCYAATYYVDFIGGSDSNNGISTSTAWQHAPGDTSSSGLPAGTKLNPGDTVILKGGVPYLGTINIKSSGQAGNPITYDGNSAGTYGVGQAIIDGQGDSLGINARQYGIFSDQQSNIGNSYIVINNFEIRNTRYIYEDGPNADPVGVYFTGRGTNIEIKNCYIHKLKPASTPVNTTIAAPSSFLTSVAVPDTQTLTDTAANFSTYATPAGRQAVYKVWLSWNMSDFDSSWGYIGPLNGSSDSVTIYKDINLTSPGWNITEPYYNPVENVFGTTASASGNVLTDTNASFNSSYNVIDNVDYLRITGGAGVTPGDYLITSHTNTSITVSGALGNSTGNVSYSVVKHYFYWIYSMAGGSSYNFGGSGITISGYSNVNIDNNIIQDAKYGIAVDCGWESACNNTNIYNNDISNTSLGIQGAPGQSVGEDMTQVNVYNNKIHDFAAWSLYDWIYHRDGMYFWGISTGITAFSGLNIYNNMFYGNIGVDDVTAQLYLEYYIQNVNIYNNDFAMTSATGGLTLSITGFSTSMPTITNVNVFNNTFSKVPGDQMHGVAFTEIGNVSMENNIFYLPELYGGIFGADSYTVTNGFGSDYNLLNNANPYPQDLSVNGTIYSLASWLSANLNFPHDVHSLINQNPLFVNFPQFAALVASTGTNNVIYLVPNTNPNYSHSFNLGDYVEYNGDGIVRQVTSISGNTITILPALPKNSQINDEVIDWGTSSNFVMNLALKNASPGIGSGTNLSSIIGSLDTPRNGRPANGNWDMGASILPVSAPISYALTVSTSNNGMVYGSVGSTVNPNSYIINCGVNTDANSCNVTESTGTEITLSAIPATGFTFSGWSGACSGTGSCTVTMSSSQSVTANFAASTVNGSCGAAAQTYLYSATSFGSNALCKSGNPNPATVAFPAPGNMVRWTCVGLNNGLNSACSAKRNPRTIVKLL